MLIKKANKTIREARNEEDIQAKVERQEALLGYIAMMTDVEIQEENEDEGSREEESEEVESDRDLAEMRLRHI